MYQGVLRIQQWAVAGEREQTFPLVNRGLCLAGSARLQFILISWNSADTKSLLNVNVSKDAQISILQRRRQRRKGGREEGL